MRILLINYEYPPLGGGGGVASANLAEQWAKQGHQVDVITSRYYNLSKIETKKNLTIYRVRILGRKNKENASLISLLTFPFNSIIAGIKLCRKNKYDFINTHFAIPSGPTGWLLSKIFKIKNILSIHGADIYDPTRKIHDNFLLKPVIQFILNQADYIVAQSRNTKENAEKYYHPKKEIKIIPLGFKRPEVNVRNAHVRLQNFKLISVGRFVPRKGFDYLIQALPNDAELVLIGDGPEKENLQNLARGKKVHFPGNISDEKKWQYYAESDCYVLSSLHEGYAIVCQEAMYMGLPIIATNFGGQTDYLKENINALFIKPKDITSLKWAIEKIHNDSELRKKMGEKNKKDIISQYIEKIADDYLNLVK